MFDEARRLREFGIMKACLSRLIDLSEQLADHDSLQQYRTLFRVLQPILQEKDHSGGHFGVFAGTSATGRTVFSDPPSHAGKVAIPSGNFSDTLTVALKSGWLPPFPFALEHCLLTARTPFITPAEIAQFAEHRSGILVFLADEFPNLGSPVSILPAITLVFHQGYLGPLPPAPPGWEPNYGQHVLRTMAVWQMNEQSGWGGFFEATLPQLQAWYHQKDCLLPENSVHFSQMFFYCLTDLENERANQS